MSLLTEAINGLALSLYEQLAGDQGNIFISPFSISTALSMLLCGARGNTEQEMRKALHFENVSISNSEVDECFEKLLSVLSKSSEKMTLTFANAILSQKDVPVSSEFKETVQKTYRALLSEVDFIGENEKAVREVNEWVKKNTNDMIPKMVESLSSDTVMMILNAIYFKGTWKYTFDVKNTHPRIFYNRGRRDEGKEVPMMFTCKQFNFFGSEKYKALQLPYENDAVTMILLLPREVEGLKDLESLLTVDLLKEITSSLHKRKVELTLPKLHIEFSKELSETFTKLGMVSAFQQDSADFSGISSTNMHVSEVVTKSVLIVNEEGCEASAATAVRAVNRRAIVSRPEKFEVDHPFLCIIYDQEKNMVLFIGRVIEF